jgi:4a-hydroxytetrahydrobiopterin dehydratase
MNELAAKKCEPCDNGKALAPDRVTEFQKKLGQGWQIAEDHHLEKSFKFKDFQEALDFTNEIGEIAEEIGHHPDIYLTWGKVRVNIFTHSANALTENDFILAAKIEEGTKGR